MSSTSHSPQKLSEEDLSDDLLLTINPAVKNYDFKDQLFLVELDENKAYSTDQIGRAIILLLAEHEVSLGELESALSKLFEEPKSNLEQGVRAFVKFALEKKLLSEVPSDVKAA